MLNIRSFLGLLLITLYWTRAKSQTECSYKYKVIPGHTACLPKSSKIKISGLKSGDKDFILNLHNDLRGKVSPTASDMVKLVWDDEIALIAQRWADNCVYAHDKNYQRIIPDRMPIGQNLGRGYSSWNSVIQAWFDEYKYFTYGVGGDGSGKAIGHYTQMVWSKTYALGCGYSDCQDLSRYYVCNYGPAGNIGDLAKPYIRGSPNSKCPAKYRTNNLCDCRRVCEAYNYLDLSTCKCKCDYPKFQLGDVCKIDCTLSKIHEPRSSCQSILKIHSNACKQFANTPFMCPITCKACVDAPPETTTTVTLSSNKSTRTKTEATSYATSKFTKTKSTSTTISTKDMSPKYDTTNEDSEKSTKHYWNKTSKMTTPGCAKIMETEIKFVTTAFVVLKLFLT